MEAFSHYYHRQLFSLLGIRIVRPIYRGLIEKSGKYTVLPRRVSLDYSHTGKDSPGKCNRADGGCRARGGDYHQR